MGRKRFAHLSEDQDEIHVDANIPWGEDTLFTLEFRDNRYALHTCNNLYLQREGGLQSSCAEDCLFSIEYHNGSLALRDRAGKYLSPVGSKVRRWKTHAVNFCVHGVNFRGLIQSLLR